MDAPSTMTESERIDRLEPPEEPPAVVLDTDAYNEIDDQFAIVYSLCSDLPVEALYAAPFSNDRSEGPGDGMEKSYEEILRILDRLDRSPDDFVFRGSTDYLPASDEPVSSPAAADLVERATDDRDGSLYVVAIGAPTNVASAILSEPSIADEIVVVWLGGNPQSWHTAWEFNLMQDLHASRVLFDSGVPLVQVPCKNVAEHVTTTVSELERYLPEHGEIGEYLLRIFEEYRDDPGPWSKEIWDLAPIAYLNNPEMVPSNLVHSPLLSNEFRYGHDPGRHFIREARHADRDAVFRDFFEALGDR